MSEDKSKDIKGVREMWVKHAETYDEWYETFEGAVEHYVDWEILRKYLPEDGDSIACARVFSAFSRPYSSTKYG